MILGVVKRVCGMSVLLLRSKMRTGMLDGN